MKDLKEGGSEVSAFFCELYILAPFSSLDDGYEPTNLALASSILASSHHFVSSLALRLLRLSSRRRSCCSFSLQTTFYCYETKVEQWFYMAG